MVFLLSGFGCGYGFGCGTGTHTVPIAVPAPIYPMYDYVCINLWNDVE